MTPGGRIRPNVLRRIATRNLSDWMGGTAIAAISAARVEIRVAAQQLHLTLVFLQALAIRLHLRAFLSELPLIGLQLELVLLNALPQCLDFLLVLLSVGVGAWGGRICLWRLLSPSGAAGPAQAERGESSSFSLLKQSNRREPLFAEARIQRGQFLLLQRPPPGEWPLKGFPSLLECRSGLLGWRAIRAIHHDGKSG
jgi:hypothetical protein